jgi:hypothetical protein
MVTPGSEGTNAYLERFFFGIGKYDFWVPV